MIILEEYDYKEEYDYDYLEALTKDSSENGVCVVNDEWNDDCPTCNGTGTVYEDDNIETCSMCSGTGIY